MYFRKILAKLKRRERIIQRQLEHEAKKISTFTAHERSRLVRFTRSVIRKFVAPVVKKIWVSKIEGLHHIPQEGAVILALNHTSYFDFLCMAAISKRHIHFLAAEKFFKSKAWKPLMRIMGQIRVDRNSADKHAMYQLVYEALEDGRIIGIFPEGTRSPDGKLLKAFTGVAKIALTAHVPVIPVGIRGTHKIMSRHHKFPRLKKANIYIGEPIDLQEFYATELTEHHFRKITDHIMHQIAKLADQIYPHAETPEQKSEIEK